MKLQNILIRITKLFVYFQCKWFKGKTEIKASDRIKIEQEGLTHRLIIHSSLMADSGKYKCVFDSTSTQCNLTVKGIEEFVERIQDVEVQEKEKAVFQVTVNNPSSTVTWHRVSIFNFFSSSTIKHWVKLFLNYLVYYVHELLNQYLF